MKKTAVTIVLLIVSFITFLTSAFGWLSLHPVLPTKIDGSLIVGYFGGGTGEAGDPYILNESRHVYNLAWLQYTGRLNEKQEGGKIKQLYFKVTDDIDMSGLVIPPIGTKVHPFVGNFNGGGHVIHNFEVANVLGEGAITERPLSVVDMGDNASIVGFFGVVGDLDGSLKGLIAEEKGVTGDKINAVYDLYLTNFIVNTITTESLIGLLAGYVNGQVENVGIGKSAIKIAERVKPLSSMSVLNTNRIFSLYSLLGYYDSTNVLWEKLPTGAELGGGDSGGEGAGFGGSMDMASLVRRLTYMLGENVMRNPPSGLTIPEEDKSSLAQYPVNFSSETVNTTAFHSVLDYSITSSSKANYRIGYLGDGSVIPLNVDTEAMFGGDDISVTATGTRADTTYLMTEYYRKNTHEKILSSNTGYIVGAGGGTDAWVRARIQTINGANDGISNSIGDGATTVTYQENLDGTYTTNLTLYTVDAEGRNSNIAKANNFKQYSSVVKNFASTISGKEMISGLRFFAGKAIGINTSNLATTEKTVSLYGADQQSYELIKGGINFHLSGAGYITAIAGTYATTGTHKLFTLYKVERSNNKITQATQIQNIWTKTENNKITDIKYNIESNEENTYKGNGYVCAFHSVNMNKLTNGGSAYYFEIPVLSGDYVLGAPITKDMETYDGAYLMYLDIGANGDITSGGEEEMPGEGGYEYGISGINFVDKNMPKTNSTFTTSIDDENYPVIVYRVAGTNASENGYNPLTAYYNREGANTMTMQYVDSNRHFTITRFPTTIDYGAPTRETSVPVLPEAVVNVRYVYKDERTNEQEAV